MPTGQPSSKELDTLPTMLQWKPIYSGSTLLMFRVGS